MIRALAWEGEVLTSCTAAQTPCAFWPLLSPQRRPSLSWVRPGRARAPPGLPRLLSQGSSGSCIPFLFSLTCLVPRAFPHLDFHLSKGRGPYAGPKGPSAHGGGRLLADRAPSYTVLMTTMTQGMPAACGGWGWGAPHLTEGQRDRSSLPGEDGL